MKQAQGPKPWPPGGPQPSSEELREQFDSVGVPGDADAILNPDGTHTVLTKTEDGSYVLPNEKSEQASLADEVKNEKTQVHSTPNIGGGISLDTNVAAGNFRIEKPKEEVVESVYDWKNPEEDGEVKPPETHAEKKEALKEAVNRIDEPAPTPRTDRVELDAMNKAEKAYLDAYKELEKKRGILNRLIPGKDFKNEEAEVARLKSEFDATLKAHGDALQQQLNISTATKERTFTVRDKDGNKVLHADGRERKQTLSVEQRKQRILDYRQFKEMRAQAKNRAEARKEALGDKKKDVLEKGLAVIAKSNAELEKRFGKYGALAIRTAIFALPAAIGVGAGAGVAALIGFGTVKISRALISFAAGASAGKIAGEIYKKAIGEGAQVAAQRNLRFGGSMGNFRGKSAKDLEKQLDALVSRADPATLEMKKNLVSIFVAAGVGFSSAMALSELVPADVATETLAKDTPGSTDSSSVSTESVAAPEAATPVAEAITGKGEGFNHLFTGISTAHIENPSAVANYLANTPATKLSIDVGAFSGTESAVLEPGDRLFLDEKQNLFFERPGQPAQLLMENDASAPEGVKVHKLDGLSMKEFGVSGSTTLEIPATPAEPIPYQEYIGASGGEVEAPVAVTEIPEAAAVETPAAPTETIPEEVAVPAETSQEPPQAVSEQVPSVSEQAPEAPVEQPVDPESVPAAPGNPRAPWEFAGVQSEPFVNPQGLEINPKEATGFTDPKGNIFVYGGTYAEAQTLAESYARSNPGVLISYEGNPIITPQEPPMRWTAAMAADTNGRIVNPEYPTNQAQLNRVPDPRVFTRKLP